MDAVLPLITAVVGILGGYIVGNRRLKFEHLHERRAEVLAKLSELLAALQRGAVTFTNFYQRGDVDRLGQLQETQRAFNELVHYYRSNEVWLAPDTCLKIEEFLDNVHLPLEDYLDDLDERGFPQTQEGRSAGLHVMRETQPLRRELIEEFRAILYPPPWYDAPLRLLAHIQARTRKPSDEDGPQQPT
jgi:hypothetical protein